MLSLPVLNTGQQMGQQLSMDDEGRDVTREFGKGDNPLQLSSKTASDHSLTIDGLRGLADDEISQDRPCMKDKIDNLIENYLLGSDDDGFLGDEVKSSSSSKDKNAAITASSLLTDCGNSSSASCPQSDSTESKSKDKDVRLSDKGQSETCEHESAETVPKTVSDSSGNVSILKMEQSEVDSTEPSDRGTGDKAKKDANGKKDGEQIKSAGADDKKVFGKNIIEPKSVTTFQTLIEKVLDTSLNNKSSEMCSKMDGERRKSAPCEDSKQEENKNEKRQESVDSSRTLSHDDMSISKRKLVCLKDHIEKVLEKSYYNIGKKSKEDGDSEEIKRSETVKEEVTVKPESDSSDFDAQQILDTLNDQTKVVNCLLSPSKEVPARSEITPAEAKAAEESEGHMISIQHRPSNCSSIENGRVSDSAGSVEGPKQAAMNKALMQGMTRLQNHVEETVANISRSSKENSGKEVENIRERQFPPTTYPGYMPARQTVQASVDRSHVQMGSGAWPRMANYQGYPGNPTPTTPIAVTTYLPSHSSANASRSPKDIQNSFYTYGAGLHHSPKGARQLSPRQPSPRHPSPRQLSPVAISPITSKTSPPNLEVHHSHYSGPANSGHQISLRDCQCASCDTKLGRKISPHDVSMSCTRAGEYAALKPGHITSGSPYHSPNSIRQPAPSSQHSLYPVECSKNINPGSDKTTSPSVSSAMALGPAPPLMYYPGNQHSFRMPQLYPSNPPIPSPREYNRVNPQAASVSPHGNYPQHQAAWKSPEQKVQHLSPRSAVGNVNTYSPSLQQMVPPPHTQKISQQQLSPSPQQLTRAGKPESYWNREERHIRKEVQYQYANESEKVQQVSPPILDLSIKKKSEPEPVEDSVDGDAPLDLTCRKPKISKSDLPEPASSHGIQSLGSYIAGAVMDKKYAAQRNAYIHHLENSVDKYCRERKSPSAGYQRQSEGYGPHTAHLADQPGPKHLYNHPVRSQELGPNQGYSQGRHDAAHPQMSGQKSIYPGQSSYSVMPGQIPGRGTDMLQRSAAPSYDKSVQHLPPQAQQNMRHIQQPHPQHPQSNHPPHLPQPHSYPSHKQPSPIPPSHYPKASLNTQNHSQPTSTPQQPPPHHLQQPSPGPHNHLQQSSLGHHNHLQQPSPGQNNHLQQPSPGQQPPQTHQPVGQQPHKAHNPQSAAPQHSHPHETGRQDTVSPTNGDSRQLSKRANNVSKHEPIQNIIGNHSPHDILYLICRLCSQTYGSPYGFRKHFRNQHGFEPRAEHTIVQTISATKTALQTPAITPQTAYSMQAANTQVPHKPSHMDPPPPLLAIRPPPNLGPTVLTNIPRPELGEGKSPTFGKLMHTSSQGSPTSSSNTGKVSTNSDISRNSVKQEAKVPAERDLSPSEYEKVKFKNDVPTGGNSPTDKKFMECPECGQTFQLNDFGLYKRHCRQHGQPKLVTPFVPGENTVAYPIEQVSSTGTPTSSVQTGTPTSSVQTGTPTSSVQTGTPTSSVPTLSSSEMSPVCKFCNIPFATVTILNDHINSIHPEKIKMDTYDSDYDKPPPIIQVTRAPAESATLSVSPDSSCEPSSTKDSKNLEEREMPVLKKQISTTSSVGSDSVTDIKSEMKCDSDSRHSATSPANDVNRQVSSESGSISENTDDKPSTDFTDDSTMYMHKKFSNHRKRKNSISAIDAITAKHLKYSSDMVSAKSPGSINSPSAYSSTSYDSETSNMLETQQSAECGDGGEVGEMDEADMDRHSKLVLKIKCGNGNINNKSEARHQLPFVWDRVTRSQAGKNIKPPKYH